MIQSMSELKDNNGLGMIITPYFYWKMYCPNKTREEFLSSFPLWSEKYPGWENKPLYMVVYREEEKQCSMEEFKDQNPHIKEDFLEREYEKVPLRATMMVPFDAIQDRLSFSGEE